MLQRPADSPVYANEVASSGPPPDSEVIESIAACLPDAPQHSLGTPKSFIPSILSPITKAVGPNYPNKLWTPPPHPFPAHHHRRLGPNPLEYLGLDKGSTGIQKMSGGRSLAPVQRAAATGLQARGAALPPLLPRGLSPDDHWSRACSLVHPMSMTPQLPGKLVLAARRIKEWVHLWWLIVRTAALMYNT